MRREELDAGIRDYGLPFFVRYILADRPGDVRGVRQLTVVHAEFIRYGKSGRAVIRPFFDNEAWNHVRSVSLNKLI